MRNTQRLVLTITALAAGCTDAGETLLLVQNQAVDANCLVPAARGSAFISRGVVDTEVSSMYVFTPLVESRADIDNNADAFERTITVQGAEISLEFADESLVNVGALDTAGAINFTQRVSGTMQPGELRSFAFIAVPNAVLQDLGDSLSAGGLTQVLATVKMFGELGGGDVDSAEFAYPIDVCKGCLQIDVGACIGYVPPLERSCFPGQDVFTQECCTSSGGARICPAVTELPPPAAN